MSVIERFWWIRLCAGVSFVGNEELDGKVNVSFHFFFFFPQKKPVFGAL